MSETLPNTKPASSGSSTNSQIAQADVSGLQSSPLDLKSTADDLLLDLDTPDYNVHHYPLEPNEVMSYSMFDDNGNPMMDPVAAAAAAAVAIESEVEDEKQLNYAQMQQQQHEEEEEATFFINAAAVSDEEEYMAGSRSGDIIGLVHGKSAAETEVDGMTHSKKEATDADDEDSAVLFEKIKVRRTRRVPISRSYPDIIQTTMTEKLYGINNPKHAHGGHAPTTIQALKAGGLKHENDHLSDSLEELTDLTRIHSHNHHNHRQREREDSIEPDSIANALNTKKLEPKFDLDEEEDDPTTAASTLLLTSSMAGGISCEKPPDSWTIDFNSLSIDDTLSECEPKSSQSNSLAYFLDINEAIPPTTNDTAQGSKHGDDDPKKIFSLFIDIGDTKQQQQQQQQYKSAGRAQRDVLNTSYYVQRKSPKPPPPSAGRQTQAQKEMQMSTVSNRSSLHVATHDLEDTMFSSSILSSMEASGNDEDMDSCLKLGMDLLKMFQEGINTDVQISVNGRVIRAHKCILASRSQYFAAILSGNRINSIELDDYSYSVVQFTLYHIYSGTNEIPDSIDLIELISLTDLLGLEGLKEIISNTIKAKFAHNFHRPCSTCIIGVIQFYPIAISYGMDDLSRKMTKWMSKHFVRIWPTKAFASLGDDLIEKCLNYTVHHLSGENLLDITLGCDQLLNTMPNIKWAETIFKIVSQLTQACVEFIGENLCSVLQSQRFLIFGKGQAWNISRIENTFLEGLQLLKPDDACLSHCCLTRLIELGTETFDEAFVDFLIMLQSEVEKFLLANASRAVLSKNWERLGENVRKKICSTGFLGYDKSGSKAQSKTGSTAKKAGANRPADSKATSSSSSSRPTSSSTRQVQATPTSWKAGQKMAESQIIESPRCAPRQILSPTEKGAKVASVRPMPSSQQQSVQHQNVFSSRQSGAGAGKPGGSSNIQKTRAKSPASSRLTSKTLSQHKPAEAYSSPPSSASSKPVTPVTPSRPNSFPYRNTKLSPRLDDNKPTTPTKPVFLTNSQKAKAVSKPNLKMRSARSNSISGGNAAPPSASAAASATHSRQSSVGSMASTATVTVQPRTPNLSQPSRYATSLGGSGTHRTQMAKVTQSVAAMPKSPAPAAKGRVQSAAAGGRRGPQQSSNSAAASSSVTPNTSRQVSVEGKKSQNKNANGASSSNNSKSKPGAGTRKKFALDFDSGSDSDSLMTRSNVEDSVPSSGEQKMRTLAEIGRSSTFSKDEPTVIGKMDCGGIDLEYTQL